MADYILESSLNSRLNTIHCDMFCCRMKTVDKFQVRLKTAASVFPFSCVAFHIGQLCLPLNFNTLFFVCLSICSSLCMSVCLIRLPVCPIVRSAVREHNTGGGKAGEGRGT